MGDQPQVDPDTADDSVPGQDAVVRELRRRRECAGLSLTELARRVGYSRTYISTSEKPGADLVSRAVVSRIDEELHAGGALIALHARADAERYSRRGRAEREFAPADSDDVLAFADVRREVSDAAVDQVMVDPLARGESDFLTSLGRRDVADRYGFRPNRSVIEESVDPITRRHCSLYHQMPSADLLPAVLAHLQMVDRMLARADGKSRRELGSTVAETAGFAAWLCSDLGDGVRTVRLYALAEEAVADCGNRALGGYIAGFRAQLFTRRGEHLRAVQRAQAARHQAGESASARVRAWLTAVHALALAYAGHASEARNTLIDAERCFESEIDSDSPEWMYDFDRTRLSAYAGACYLTLREPVEAERALREALAELPVACGRRRAEVDVDLAYALMLKGQLDEAIELAGMAVEAFSAWQSGAGLDRIISFSTSLIRLGNRDAARSLHEQVLAARASW